MRSSNDVSVPLHNSEDPLWQQSANKVGDSLESDPGTRPGIGSMEISRTVEYLRDGRLLPGGNYVEGLVAIRSNRKGHMHLCSGNCQGGQRSRIPQELCVPAERSLKRGCPGQLVQVIACVLYDRRDPFASNMATKFGSVMQLKECILMRSKP